MSIFPHIDLWIQCNLKTPVGFFLGKNWHAVSNIQMEMQQIQNKQNNFEKEEWK